MVLVGAQMPAGCGRRSRTHQITRKRPYKTLNLQRHKSRMAMTTPGGAFFVITRKKIVPIAKFAFHGMAGERAAANSADHGGNRTATHTTDASPQPAFPPMGQDCLSFGAASSRRGINPRQSPPRGFCAVGASPEGGKRDFRRSFAEKFFRKKPSYSRRGLQINCNKRGI